MILKRGWRPDGSIDVCATVFDELPTRAEFKKIAWNSMVRCERELDKKLWDSVTSNVAVGMIPGWRCCECGFETVDNDEFYEHLMTKCAR